VRTIDLSGPEVSTSRNSIPVTADAPPAPARSTGEDRDDEMPEAATA
jgi:hypothetical protein